MPTTPQTPATAPVHEPSPAGLTHEARPAGPGQAVSARLRDGERPRAPRLAELRDRWLSAAVGALQDDSIVVGAALVGSLGAGRADDWSDVDLLLVVDDEHLEEYAVPDCLPRGPGRLEFAIDARHNGPVGTRAIGAQCVVDGLAPYEPGRVRATS
jgi:hypothetical protein